MQNLKISSAQFEHKSGDKAYNLSVIDNLSKKAKEQGADVIAFHECSITGYTFARQLSKEQMLTLAEFIPEGESIEALKTIASKHNIVILAGLFEKDAQDNLFKAYVCVDKNGLVAKFRKLHPFINSYLTPGNEYCVFELFGWKCGILICYDNNIVENVRATKLLGADIIFMPHVTMCTPSTRPGAGFVDPKLWENRETDPTSLRLEFDGLKGREWLMKWLPARAYDNAIYAVFSNAIGMETRFREPRTMLGTVVATVALIFVPNCSAAIVTNIAQKPVPNPSSALTIYNSVTFAPFKLKNHTIAIAVIP